MFTATTILAVKKDGHTAMAGDGQVTMGNAVIMKNTARKVRRLYHGKIIAGFAGSVADAFSLLINLNPNSVTAMATLSGQRWNLPRTGAVTGCCRSWRPCSFLPMGSIFSLYPAAGKS